MSFIYLFIIVLLAYLADKKSNSSNNFLYKILLIAALSILPVAVGDKSTDHETYESTYRNISGYSKLEIDGPQDLLFNKVEGQEMGFVLIERLLGIIGISTVGFFFIISFVSNTLFVSSFFRFKYPVIILFLFISSAQFLQEPNLVRQILAVSVIFYSLRYVVEKNWKLYLVLLFIAYLIHHSSIVCLIFMPLCFNRNLHKYYFYGLMFFWLLSILIAFKVLPLDLSYLNAILGFSEGYTHYLNFENGVGVGRLKFDFVYNIIVIIVLLLYKKNASDSVYYYSFIMGAVLLNITISMPNMYRIGLYFSIASPVLLPSIMSTGIEKKQFRAIAQVLSILFFLYYLRAYFLNITSFFD